MAEMTLRLMSYQPAATYSGPAAATQGASYAPPVTTVQVTPGPSLLDGVRQTASRLINYVSGAVAPASSGTAYEVPDLADALQQASNPSSPYTRWNAIQSNPESWFISQWKSDSNTNEDVLRNGNCGPTSVAMVAKAFGKINPSPEQADAVIEDTRRRIGESQNQYDGTSLGGLARAARSYGLDASVMWNIDLNTIQDELAKGRLPIVLVKPFYLGGTGSGHYTVVRAVKNGKVYLNDPAHATGPMVLDASTFMQAVAARGAYGMVSVGG